MSSERVFAQDFNATRIRALSYLFAEIGPKIKIRSLSLPFPLKVYSALTIEGVIVVALGATEEVVLAERSSSRR